MSQLESNAPFDQPRSASIGLAVAAIIFAALGFCIPGAGIVGLILGIVAVVKASSTPLTHGGKGVAIAGIVVGSLTIPWMCIAFGIFLPAIGAARNAARSLKSMSQAKQIAAALTSYAHDNKEYFPETTLDWQTRLASYNVPRGDFISPHAPDQVAATDSYIYIPGFKLDTIHDPSRAIILYENPKYVPHGMLTVVYASGVADRILSGQLDHTLAEAEKPGDSAPDAPSQHPLPRPPTSRGGG